MPITFRRGTPGDVHAIAALVESAYRGDTSRKGWTTEADLLDGQRTDAQEIGELMAAADSRFLLAHRAQTLVGNVLITRYPTCVHLGMFAVRPTEQAGGVGRSLLAYAEEIARSELNMQVMEMTVITVRTELIAWYERRGYARTGEERPFPYGNERAGLPRRDDLRFMVLRKAL